MGFRLGHHELGGIVNAVIWTIPINDDAIDPTADHVCNLAMNLVRVIGAVANIHVIRLPKPKQQVRIDFCLFPGVKQ